MVYLYFLHMCLEVFLLGWTLRLLYDRRKLAVLTLAAYFLHPFVTESALALLFRTLPSMSWPKVRFQNWASLAGVFPVVYSPEYNIRFFGLEKGHSFDTIKYERVFDLLAQGNGAVAIEPGTVNYSLLYRHTGIMHLIKLNYAYYFSRISEMPLRGVPGPLLRWFGLRPFLYATQGTITATGLALHRGFAVNLGGGFHHAHTFGGSGFCFYNDIWLAVWYLWENYPERSQRVMIIDLDAHQGNGHERDKLYALKNYSLHEKPYALRSSDVSNKSVFILDAYNPFIFPHDEEALRAIDREVLINSSMDDAKYLEEVSKAMEESLEAFKPDFIFYNAGTDVLAGDRLGRLSLTPQGVIQRDAMVVAAAQKRAVPLVMLLSGGYTPASAEVVAASLVNLRAAKRATPQPL